MKYHIPRDTVLYPGHYIVAIIIFIAVLLFTLARLMTVARE